jgi:ethanolamine ammonia-lyase small subunit
MAEPPVLPTDATVTHNPWQALRRHTPARIALGRAGVSLPTAVQLDFQLAHARARDAVHRPLDSGALCADLATLGLDTVLLHSAAPSRDVYLKRPDLGRRLSDASVRTLAEQPLSATGRDLVVVVADGLSSLAVQRHTVSLLAALRPRLPAADWSIGPVAVVEQGRVAVGDAIGEALRARLVVVLIGERPGLSSPDSLGIYLTWSPRSGRTDAERNCISNVRPQGLAPAEAAARLAWLLAQARARRLTGVGLKDEHEAPLALGSALPGLPSSGIEAL